MFGTGNFLLDSIGVVTALLAIGVAFFKWKFAYWERRGLETLDPIVPFGNIKDTLLGRKSFGFVSLETYKKIRAKGLKHAGIYSTWRPSYVPVDPTIIKHIMQNDFAHFPNHGGYVNEKADPLSGHLFNLSDGKWRNMRTKLTPTFTSGKMKMMFHTMTNCAENLKEVVENFAQKKTVVDIKDTLERFTTDIIGSAAFGLECNSLKNPEAEFRNYGKKNFETDIWVLLKIITLVFIPRSFLTLINFRFIKKEVEDFYMRVVRETVNYREQNNVQRKDFMQLLIQLKNGANVTEDTNNSSNAKTKEPGLTMNELTAQAYVFFLAGYETSSTTMTWALFELSQNQAIQQKLREEITKILAEHNNEITYESVMAMTYLDQVVSETLRMYPPLGVLNRECVKEYQIPGTDVIIEKGTRISIPVWGIQTDPEYYPKPEKFDPDRFTEENKSKRPPFTWFPFGEGPRICIGLRFGLMQVKVGLITILRNHRVTLNEKTTLPVVYDPKSFITAKKGGVWLNIENI